MGGVSGRTRGFDGSDCAGIVLPGQRGRRQHRPCRCHGIHDCALAGRVQTHATRVTEADGRYTLNEADSADEMTALTRSTIVV